MSKSGIVRPYGKCVGSNNFPLRCLPKTNEIYVYLGPMVSDGSVLKNPPVNVGDTGDAGSRPGFGMIPWKRKWQLTPVFLPGKSHAQTSLEGCSQSMGRKSEWDMNE